MHHDERESSVRCWARKIKMPSVLLCPSVVLLIWKHSVGYNGANGQKGSVTTTFIGGGGGGAGGARTSKHGGLGAQIDITGLNVWYAAGGGGGCIDDNYGGYGGNGICGGGHHTGLVGTTNTFALQHNGLDNTGTGGGGGGFSGIKQYPETPSTNTDSWTDNGYNVVCKTSDTILSPQNTCYLFNNLIASPDHYHSAQLFSGSSPYNYTGSTSTIGSSI